MPRAVRMGTVVTFPVRVRMHADRVGVIAQRSGKQCGCCGVGISGGAGIQRNACFGQSRTGTAADSAANQCGDALRLQKRRKGAVSAAGGGQNRRVCDPSVCGVVYLELLCVAEMRKNPAVFIGNCNTPEIPSPFLTYVVYIVPHLRDLSIGFLFE